MAGHSVDVVGGGEDGLDVKDCGLLGFLDKSNLLVLDDFCGFAFGGGRDATSCPFLGMFPFDSSIFDCFYFDHMAFCGFSTLIEFCITMH